MTTPSKMWVKCTFCGHENPPANRFCGMCSRALPETPRQIVPSSAPLLTADDLSSPDTFAPIASHNSEFPGESSAPPANDRADNRNRDVTYLLHEDEGDHSSRNRGLVIAGIFILILSLGGLWISGGPTAFVKWFQGGKPTATAATSELPRNELPKNGESQNPETRRHESRDGAKANESSAHESTATPTQSFPPEDAHEKIKVSDSSAEKSSAAEPIANAPAQEIAKDTKTAPATSKVHTTKAAKPAAPKVAPPPDPDLADMNSPDCERRLNAVRRVANRGDGNARTKLGAMYAAGECVARDLPTAYHWYALALHADPENTTISANLEAIWRQMSPAERQVATRPQQ